MFVCVFVFFLKQKTAYELRISDWSSDVCSSDLIALAADAGVTMDTLVRQADIAMYHCKEKGRNRHIWFETGMEMAVQARNQIETGIRAEIGRASCRERVCQYV